MSHVDSYREPAEREPEPPEPKNWAKILFFAALSMTFVFAGWAVTRGVLSASFSNNCGEYLAQASSSTTPEKALQDLESVIEYAEYNSMTEGFTTIAWSTPPSEDVGRWYESLTDIQEQLQGLVDDEPQDLGELSSFVALKSQQFQNMKTLIRQPPDGISIFGYNQVFFLWFVISSLGALGLWIAYGVMKPDYRCW